MNDDHIVIAFDLETLDTNPNGVILSLGIVMFDITAANTFEELVAQGFNIYFDQKQQIEADRSISDDTVDWWERQGDEAKECLNNPHQVSCENLHKYLAAFYTSMGKKPNPKTCRWFSRGHFDASFLENFCRTFEIDPPYKFWTWRDSRSYLDGAGIGTRNEKIEKPKELIPHNSHHDAAFEAMMLQQFYARTRK